MKHPLKLLFITLLIFVLLSCEKLNNSQIVAGAIVLALLSDGDSPNKHKPCYGLDNTNCDPGLSEDAIWKIRITSLSQNPEINGLGDFSDFEHFLRFDARDSAWHSDFFILIPGSNNYLHEVRSGSLSLSGEKLELVQLITESTSCEESESLITLYDEPNFLWEISRLGISNLSLKEPNVNIYNQSQKIREDINSSSFTSIIGGLVLFPIVLIVESFAYMFTSDFWQSLLEGDFYFESFYWQQLELYSSNSIDGCFSSQGIEDTYQSILSESTEDEMKITLCEHYIEGFKETIFNNEEVLDDCEEILNDKLIEELCGHLSGVAKDICIAAI